MIVKYKPDKAYRHIYNNKKVIYCKIIQATKVANTRCYKVKMLNHHNMTNLLMESELEKLNLLDKIKLLFIKEK